MTSIKIIVQVFSVYLVLLHVFGKTIHILIMKRSSFIVDNILILTMEKRGHVLYGYLAPSS